MAVASAGRMPVCTSLQIDNHASTQLLSFLQAECPSCRPTNSVKALKANVRMCLNPCKSDKHEKFAVSARRTRNVFSVSGKGNMHAKCRNVKPGDCRRRLSVNDSLESGRFALRTRDFLQPLNDLWHRCRCRSNINTLYFSEYVPHFVTKLT